jgi:putative phosphoribosyl transferase
MPYRDEDLLVLGIPSGGVPVAAQVARRLGAELDVIIARKLGVPDQPELAMGAVTADGGLYVVRETVTNHEVTGDQLAAVIARETERAQAGERSLRGERPNPRIADRAVIVVDDGLATGATMRAALRAVRAQGPSRLVAAVPVGPRDARQMLGSDADEVVCLRVPHPFEAVGLHYDDFQAVAGETVERILHEFHAAANPSPAGPHQMATSAQATERGLSGRANVGDDQEKTP